MKILPAILGALLVCFSLFILVKDTPASDAVQILLGVVICFGIMLFFAGAST